MIGLPDGPPRSLRFRGARRQSPIPGSRAKGTVPRRSAQSRRTSPASPSASARRIAQPPCYDPAPLWHPLRPLRRLPAARQGFAKRARRPDGLADYASRKRSDPRRGRASAAARCSCGSRVQFVSGRERPRIGAMQFSEPISSHDCPARSRRRSDGGHFAAGLGVGRSMPAVLAPGRAMLQLDSRGRRAPRARFPGRGRDHRPWPGAGLDCVRTPTPGPRSSSARRRVKRCGRIGIDPADSSMGLPALLVSRWTARSASRRRGDRVAMERRLAVSLQSHSWWLAEGRSIRVAGCVVAVRFVFVPIRCRART